MNIIQGERWGRLDTQGVLDQAVDLFKEELGDNLVGIYLHGSLAMGCFNPDTSDIDLLLVVADKLTRDHMRRLAKNHSVPRWNAQSTGVGA